jgi:hypothetical protein
MTLTLIIMGIVLIAVGVVSLVHHVREPGDGGGPRSHQGHRG